MGQSYLPMQVSAISRLYSSYQPACVFQLSQLAIYPQTLMVYTIVKTCKLHWLSPTNDWQRWNRSRPIIYSTRPNQPLGIGRKINVYRQESLQQFCFVLYRFLLYNPAWFGIYCVIQSDLELVVNLLSRSLKYRDYRHEPPHVWQIAKLN